MHSNALRWTSAGLAALALCSGCSTFDDGGPRRWSKEWYEQQAQMPVSARQKYDDGKWWPPYPRPIGEDPPCSHVHHAAKYWPHPYVCDDRAYVQNLSDMQVSNGWIAEATLYDYHFDPLTQQLNSAGRMHLKWILETAPAERRFVWVQTSTGTEVSQQRMTSAHDEAVALAGDGNVPPIMLRVGGAAGRPASEIDKLRRDYLQAMPQPKIEYTALPTGTGQN